MNLFTWKSGLLVILSSWFMSKSWLDQPTYPKKLIAILVTLYVFLPVIMWFWMLDIGIWDL